MDKNKDLQTYDKNNFDAAIKDLNNLTSRKYLLNALLICVPIMIFSYWFDNHSDKFVIPATASGLLMYVLSLLSWKYHSDFFNSLSIMVPLFIFIFLLIKHPGDSSVAVTSFYITTTFFVHLVFVMCSQNLLKSMLYNLQHVPKST